MDTQIQKRKPGARQERLSSNLGGMNPTISIDDKAWKKAMRDLFETSSRSLVDFINGQSLKVAIESVRNTKKVDPVRIRHELGAVGRAVSFKTMSRGKNKGKIRTVRGAFSIKENSFAEKILGARFRETGEFGVRGLTMEERASNLIKARMRGAGFVASGWIPARNILFRLVKQKPKGTLTIAGARQLGRAKGDAKPARFSLASNIQATIENRALNAKPTPPEIGGDARPKVREGLQSAMNVAARDMIEELSRRLNKDLAKFKK